MRIVDEEVEERLSEYFDENGSVFEEDKEMDCVPVPQEEPEVRTLAKPSIAPTSKKSFKTYPVIVPEYPYVFIHQIQQNPDTLTSRRKVVTVKACIGTVINNLKVDSGRWALKVCINDGTGYPNFLISSNLLDTLIGFTVGEVKALKGAKSKEGKERVAEVRFIYLP